MVTTPPRIPPARPEDLTDEQKALLGNWGSMNFAAVMVNHPALYRVFVPVIAKVIAATDLPPRDRQILVLRTLALGGDVYESHHHELISHGAGMTDADIAAARTDGPSLSPFEHLLVTAADELVDERCVSDATWNALAERYSRVELMELVAVVGAYNMMSMLTRSFGMELEDEETFHNFTKIREYK